MLDALKDKISTVSCATQDAAKFVGSRTASLAKRVGPTRGAIVLGVIGVGVGAYFLVRYLRAEDTEEEFETAAGGAPTKKQRRRRRTAAADNAHA
jgi:hypothetical protein